MAEDSLNTDALVSPVISGKKKCRKLTGCLFMQCCADVSPCICLYLSLSFELVLSLEGCLLTPLA